MSGSGSGPLDRSALKEHALRGLRPVTVARVATGLLALASSIVLARLVPPADFGRAAVALIAVALAVTLATEGISSPLVQRRSIDHAALESAFFISLAIGAVATLGTLLLAEFAFADIFGEETADLILLCSPAFMVAAAGAVPNALLLRSLDFGATSAAEIAAAIAGVAVAVTLALAGLDAVALVAGGLAGLVATTIVILVLGPSPPRPRWRSTAARQIAGFGVPATFASIVHALQENIDYAILAAKLPPAQVGFYWRAYQLGVQAQGRVGGIVMRMAFPLYSRSANLDDLRATRVRIARIHAAVIIPALCLFIAVAPELVPWLFGSDWQPAVGPSQILAVAGMATALGTGNGPAVLAVGRPGFLLGWHVLRLAVFVAVVLVTAPQGVTAVCWGVVGFRVAFLVGGYVVLLGRLVGVHVRRLWADAFPLTVGGSEAGLPAPVTIAGVTLVAGSLYLGALATFFPKAMADIVAVTKAVLAPARSRPGARPPVPAGEHAAR